MKKHLGILFFCFFTINLFAYNGLMWETGKLKVTKTEWFDIIYTDECETGAKILYENADEMYKEISELYGVEPGFRMPVVLSSNQENYNAYWSNTYANHIVLFVTSAPESLMVFSEDLLSCFRHELTHAVTYNLKDPFWSWIGKTFGDPIYLPGLLVTNGRAEGATLASESMNGEGRLNNEYALQMIKQAKLEDQFPNYAHVQGASDIYPKGCYYNFNGAFDQWIQKQYGMEKYAEYWYRMVNAKDLLFIGRTFKKVYGVKVKDVWARFLQEFEVPDIPANPVEAGIVKDFFIPGSVEYSKQNKAGALYSGVSVCDKGIIFTDKNTSGVYFVSNEQLKASQVKPKKLFTLSTIQTSSISADGRLIVSDFISQNYANEKYKLQLYDVQTKQTFVVKGTGKKLASVVQKGSDYYLVYQKFSAQNTSIEIAEIKFNNNKISEVNPLVEIKFGLNEYPYNFVDLQDGSFAYLKKSGLSYCVCVCDLEGNLKGSYACPKDRMVIRDMSYSKSEDALYFSWTEPKSMPRLGKFNPGTQSFSLNYEDISGGIYSPVVQNGQLIYAGDFFRENRLLTRPEGEIAYTDYTSDIPVSLAEYTAGHDYSSVVLDSKKYKRTDFLKGIWFPISTLQSQSFEYSNLSSFPLFLGATVRNSNPWDGDIFELSVGYGTATNSIGIGSTYSSGTNTQLFKYSLRDFIEIDFYKGFKQIELEGTTSSTLSAGKHSAVSLENTSLFHNGRTNNYEAEGGYKSFFKGIGNAVSTDLTNYVYFVDAVTLSYSNLIKAGPGKYERFGFGIAGSFMYEYNGTDYGTIFQNGMNLGINTLFYIPKLIPVTNRRGFVSSLPTKIRINLFTSSVVEKSIGFLNSFIGISRGSLFTDYDLVSLGTETVLFEMDIQKNIAFLYFHDIRLSFDYLCGILNTPETYMQNWKITHVPEYVEMLNSGELKFSGYPYLKLTLGCSTSGQLYTKKSNFCMKFGLEGLGTETIVPKFDIYVDTGF